MAESFITQCPHCGTSFRVRTEQLSVANGSVRCGACLQVFSARNHVMTTSVPAQSTKPADKKPAPAAGGKWQTPEQAPSKPSATRPTPEKPAPKPDDFRFASDEDDDAEFLFSDGDDENDDEFIFDDNAGDSLFDEDDDKDDGLGEFSDSFLSLNASSDNRRDVNHFQKESREMREEFIEDPEEDDESWAESMLDEIEQEDKVPSAKSSAFSRPAPERQPEPIRSTQTFSQTEFNAEPEEEFSYGERSASHVVNKASQEIELDFHMDERLHRLRPLGWLIILLLLALLAGQLAWLFRDTYARMDQWRGLYQAGCNVIGCDLPEQIDLDTIRASVLVRNHKDPQLSDIRMVDVVLTNRAAFKQPFPVIVMQYTDVNGKLVADQSFLPGNYLKGELTGVKLMPINTRVYISFPIQSPPGNAVNYQILLQKNDG